MIPVLYRGHWKFIIIIIIIIILTTFLRALILWQCDKIKFHGVTPACQSRDLACTCRQRSPSAMLWTISGTESLCRVYRQSHQRSCCPDHSKIPNHQCTRRHRPRKPTAQICNCGTSRHIWQFSWQQLARLPSQHRRQRHWHRTWRMCQRLLRLLLLLLQISLQPNLWQ